MTQESSDFLNIPENNSLSSVDNDIFSESGVVSKSLEEFDRNDINNQDTKKSTTAQVRLNFNHLRHITYELGLIKLCWPEIGQPIFENRNNFPKSYMINNNKEKVLLLYAENFRVQFCNKYPKRKPLFLACKNECGIQVSSNY